MTQAREILDGAIKSALVYDRGASELTDDTPELLNVIGRKVRQIYTLAALPRERGGMGEGDYFQTSAPVTLAAGPVPLPASAFAPSFTNAAGERVSVVPRANLIDGSAEMPPAVVVERQQVSGAGRAGDPVASDVLTVYYTPVPPLPTLEEHYIGAMTLTDPATSQWPESVGDPFLIAWLTRYLATKSGDRTPAELEAVLLDLSEAAQLLATVIGVNATRLIEERDGDA